MDWIAPTATVGIKSHKEILDLVAWAWEKVLGKKINLALTGMEGVGKTALLHTLTGESLQPGYQKPTRSQKMEKGKLKTSEGKILLSCVPGQIASPRYVALDELFLGRSAVNGVIHVVANGLATVRSEDAAAILVGQGITTIDKFQELQRQRELEDLRETCRYIRQAHRKHRAPSWLILAVDKVDLYHGDIEAARGYYAGESGFTQVLRELTRQVGEDFFRWDAVPISGWREPFVWNRQSLPSEMQDDLWRHYAVQFLQELQSR